MLMILACTTSAVGLPETIRFACGQASQEYGDLDWSQYLIDSTLTRYPDPRQFGSWAYLRGLYLFGQYLVYKRTGDVRYLKYIEDWVDAHLDAEGYPDHQVHALDDVLAANLFVVLYQETHESRYKVAAESFRRGFGTFPGTSDGGFWHANTPSRRLQLWLDGNYMAVPFLLRYGQTFQDTNYANQEAVHHGPIHARITQPTSGAGRSAGMA